MTSACRGFLFWAVALSLLGLSEAHFRLTVPMSRKGPGYENDPIGSNTNETFVCRNAQPNPALLRPNVVAGGSLTLKWEGGAHVGDCAAYISYDVDRPRSAQRYVKIANLPDCRRQLNQDVAITVPAVLPAGPAILRWDQYALHQGSFIEWYCQCADISVISSSDRAWEGFNSFSIINPPVYPSGPSSPPGFRRSTSVMSDADFYMTGPACVDDSLNQCGLTAQGTRGYTGFGGGDVSAGGGSGGSVTTPTTAAAPSSTPAPSSTTIPPTGAPWTPPSPSPLPAPAPAGAPSCVPSEAIYASLADFCATAPSVVGSCLAPVCKEQGSALLSSAKRHSFRANALIQDGTVLGRYITSGEVSDEL